MVGGGTSSSSSKSERFGKPLPGVLGANEGVFEGDLLGDSLRFSSAASTGWKSRLPLRCLFVSNRRILRVVDFCVDLGTSVLLDEDFLVLCSVGLVTVVLMSGRSSSSDGQKSTTLDMVLIWGGVTLVGQVLKVGVACLRIRVMLRLIHARKVALEVIGEKIKVVLLRVRLQCRCARGDVDPWLGRKTGRCWPDNVQATMAATAAVGVATYLSSSCRYPRYS